VLFRSFEWKTGKSASCRKFERAFGRQAKNFERVGSLDTGDLKLRQTQDVRDRARWAHREKGRRRRQSRRGMPGSKRRNPRKAKTRRGAEQA